MGLGCTINRGPYCLWHLDTPSVQESFAWADFSDDDL